MVGVPALRARGRPAPLEASGDGGPRAGNGDRDGPRVRASAALPPRRGPAAAARRHRAEREACVVPSEARASGRGAPARRQGPESGAGGPGVSRGALRPACGLSSVPHRGLTASRRLRGEPELAAERGVAGSESAAGKERASLVSEAPVPEAGGPCARLGRAAAC